MSPALHAIGIGIRRGVIEYGIKLRTPSELGFTILGIAGGAIALIASGDGMLEGTAVPTALYILAAIFAVLVLMGAGWGAATEIAAEYEDGTLLRARALPHGLRSYAVGAIVRLVLELAVTVGVMAVIAAIVLGPKWSLPPERAGMLLAVTVLGVAAITPFAFLAGSLVRNPRAVGGWGFLIMGALVWAGGIIVPIVTFPGWAQVLGQLSPTYWIGLGYRGALFPEAGAVIELGGGFRPGWVLLVLAAWAAVGLVLAPLVLARTVRRESGAAVAERRHAALGRI